MSAVFLQDLARCCEGFGVPLLPRLLERAVKLLHHAGLAPGATLGPGTELVHGGLGIQIATGTVIGRGCRIFEHVSLARGGDLPGAPVLEDFVTLEPGAAIVGGVRIGRGAVICANVHVRHHVPAGMRVERDVLKPLAQVELEIPRVNQMQVHAVPLFPVGADDPPRGLQSNAAAGEEAKPGNRSGP